MSDHEDLGEGGTTRTTSHSMDESMLGPGIARIQEEIAQSPLTQSEERHESLNQGMHSPAGETQDTNRLTVQLDNLEAEKDWFSDDGVKRRNPGTMSTPRTLEDRHRAINTLFGIKPYKGHISRRSKDERSAIVKELLAPVTGHQSVSIAESTSRNKKRVYMVNIGNIIYCATFGFWCSLIYALFGLLCIASIILFPYGVRLLQLSLYYLWPFGKYLERHHPESKLNETTQLLSSKNIPTVIVEPEDSLQRVSDEEAIPPQQERFPRLKAFGRQVKQFFTVKKRAPLQWIQFIIFSIFIAPWLGLFSHGINMVLSWFSVFFIPVSKINLQGLRLLLTDPITISVERQFPPKFSADIQLCSYTAMNLYYYKYSVFGMNVILVNLLPCVFLSIALGMFFGEEFVHKFALIIFPMCLLSTIPLAYYIGKAVSSISAQTSFAFGAILNATFGTIIELILYLIALANGYQSLVLNSIIGSILGSMLLMPGISMVFGGIKHKEQYFNTHASGVSSVLLLISIIGAFAPSFFYQFHGNYSLNCGQCIPFSPNDVSAPLSCIGCNYVEKEYWDDEIYINRVRYLMYACCGLLPIAYAVGLLFTLRTHNYLYEKPVGDPNDPDTLEKPNHGHGTAEWGKFTSFMVLLLSTTLFALVAECMVKAMDPALETLNIHKDFAGVTVVAVIPNISEYINAAGFALQNNIVLSLEIGNVAAIQIALLQMPALVAITGIFNKLGWIYTDHTKVFALIFENMHLYTVLFSILVLNYILINGRSNYFDGSSLIIIYILIICGFFFHTLD